MKVIKIETNYSRKLFFQTKEIRPGQYKEKIENQIINIYKDIKYQKFIGFGGAITQSAGDTYKKLPQKVKNDFLNDYFKICNYNLCRIPIGSCDFSPEMYSYSYKKDLSDFSIENDKKYIISLIYDILKINEKVKFLASPWSPPAFMKDNKALNWGGKLKIEFYDVYARYLVKFIKEYAKLRINIDYITIQNEPNAIQTWESCIFTKDEEIKFVKDYLYPEFIKEGIKTKILIYDHNKEKVYNWGKYTFENCLNIDGIAYHWYTGDHFENLDILSNKFKDKLFIHTEGCVGYSNYKNEDEVINAEKYAHDILGDLTHGCNGYIDWNLILDNNGGPNHKNNYCNSPIMLDKEKNKYYKNLCYYYIAHFAKTILPNAVRIATSKYTDKIEVIAFENENKDIGVVLLNKNDQNFEYNLCIDNKCIHDNLDSHAIVSYIIKNK